MGGGLTGAAISRALAAAGIQHYLIGKRPPESPRLGESLNAEGSVEMARQFPDLLRYCHPKRQFALFFGEHALEMEALQSTAGRAYYPLMGLPATVRLLHVDRVGLDIALWDPAVANPLCVVVEDAAVGLDYDRRSDFVAGGSTSYSTFQCHASRTDSVSGWV